MTQHRAHANPVSHLQVSAAREYLAAGISLKDTAALLGVLTSDLDQGLWKWFGIDLETAPRRYQPDFVA